MDLDLEKETMDSSEVKTMDSEKETMDMNEKVWFLSKPHSPHCKNYRRRLRNHGWQVKIMSIVRNYGTGSRERDHGSVTSKSY